MQKTEFQVPAAANDDPGAAQLRAHRCETCKYSHNNPAAAEQNLLDLSCHRLPPRAQPMFGPPAKPGQMPRLLGAYSTFPPVNAGEWCGEWAPPFAVMQ